MENRLRMTKKHKKQLTERNACEMNQFPAHDSSDLSFGANANDFTV